MRRSTLGFVLLALLFVGCGAAELGQPIFPPTPLSEVTTQTVDNVLVSFRVEQIEQFQATEFKFQGSVKNLGMPRVNARFEALERYNVPDPNGRVREQVIAVQPYGRLDMGQTQIIALSAVVANIDSARVIGRFVSDPLPVRPGGVPNGSIAGIEETTGTTGAIDVTDSVTLQPPTTGIFDGL